MRSRLLATCAACAFTLVANTAVAQSATEPAPSTERGSSTENSERGLDEIVVTANRREQSVQDSSTIVQALSADALDKAGISQPGDLAGAVAGVEIGLAGPALQIYVRGVGNPGSTAVANPAVPINVDGVYVARSQATAGSFFDLERVEVLKGPQGTLYGRNASGGAINLIPVRPKLGETSGFVSGEAGNYNLFGFEGALNVPLGEFAAIRASGQIINRDGYLSDSTDDDKHESARLQLLLEPNEKLSIALWANYTHVHGRGGGYSYVGAPDPWDSIYPGGNAILLAGAAARGLIAPQPALPPGIDGPIAGPAPSPPFPPGSNLLYLVNPVKDSNYANMDFWNIHATIDYDLEFAKLTVIPAYQRARLRYITQPGLSYEALGVTDGNAPETSATTSLELRLAGETGPVNWVTGLYYYDEDQRVYNRINNGLLQNFQFSADIDTKSFGAFGDVTLKVTDQLRLLGGLRYSSDKIVRSNFERFAIAPALGPVLCIPANSQNIGGVQACQFTAAGAPVEAKYSKLNWKGGFEFDLAGDHMLFGTASTGYKSGGLSLAATPAFKPELLTAFTLGMRNAFLDGNLVANFELFYWLYDDHQEFLVGPDSTGAVTQQFINAGKAEARGVSLDLMYRAGRNDRFALSVEYNDASYKSFTYQQSAQFTDPSTACALTDTGRPANDPRFNILSIDCGGLQLSRAPTWSGTASYSHDFNLANGGVISAGVAGKFASSRWTNVTFQAGTRASAYQTVDANLTYTSPNEAVSIMAYVRNITEDAVYGNSNGHSVVSDLIGITVGAPRTYGVRVKYNF